jgi:phosphatidylethanolamine/phosphatidyl-N-methylethanolamine N-methyltransferase
MPAMVAKTRNHRRMHADLDHATMSRAYAKWAPVYDAVCGPFFRAGRKAAAAAARPCGRDILEIGVGTGLSFEDYGPENVVIGIDVSTDMIEKARRRLRGGRFAHVAGLHVMDAHDLEFDDASFDGVVGQFVITLVANPERVLDECARVLRPGGVLTLVNHLYSEDGVQAALERKLARPARQLGLRPDFPFARFEAWIASRDDMTLLERRAIKPFGWFTLLRFRKS